ncbi:MAG: hypothetical protein WCG83_04840 [Candidatus Peregrinibacteria bacterium]
MQTTERVLPLPVVGAKRIYLLTFFTVITIAPFFIAHVQLLTGPLVNAVLILACVLLGPTEAVTLGLFPSTVALMSGLLPLAFAPMVPFIIISNAIYVLGFAWSNGKSRKSRNTKKSMKADSSPSSISSFSSISFSIIFASVLKYLFLVAVVRIVMSRFIDGASLPTLTFMMGLPQLITALIGGAIALAILSVLKRRA